MVAPAEGMIPRFTSICAKRQSEAATTMSDANINYPECEANALDGRDQRFGAELAVQIDRINVVFGEQRAFR